MSLRQTTLTYNHGCPFVFALVHAGKKHVDDQDGHGRKERDDAGEDKKFGVRAQISGWILNEDLGFIARHILRLIETQTINIEIISYAANYRLNLY